MTKNPHESRPGQDAAPDQKNDLLSPDLQGHIGRRLKAYYDTVASEPIPDRFKQLLEQLGAEPERPEAEEPPAKTGT